ncbi:hypothetical protein E4U17_001398 [Claviceps sp. LM77 group G4]|nr:hypothetical protein E4U17_001398 [Claviceps sp. LM77 group G4]
MAAFHKQQQADQRTKLKSRPPDATSDCLGPRPVATYQNWHRRHGFLANNVVLRNDASKLDLSAGSLVPRGERPPVLKRQIIGRKPSRVQQGDLDFAVT